MNDYTPKTNEIFVFGSNLSGRHGKGAALCALKNYGAVYGQGFGFQGVSFAIPTKCAKLKPLPLIEIAKYVDAFIDFAIDNPELNFFVTAIGTGLAGYQHKQIAPLFKNSPANCRLPPEWA